MPFESGHALVVGVGTYANHSSMNVPVTTGDARAVANVLRDPARCGYPDSQVRVLTEAEATRGGILAELRRLAETTTVDSTVVLFYAGHGEYDATGSFVITTHDTRMDGKFVVDGSGITAAELLTHLRAIPARRALLLINACHAGALAPAALGGNDAVEHTGQPLPDEVAAALLGTGAGRVLITACRPAQKSWFVRAARQTFFGLALVHGLNGTRITPRRNTISLFDLYDDLFTTVRSTAQEHQLVQEPVLTISQGVGVMAVALHQGKPALGTLGPGDAPESSRGVVREVPASESSRLLEAILKGEVTFGPSAMNSVIQRGDGPQLAAGRDIRDTTLISDHQQHVRGDQITTGNITGSTGVAIGRRARSTVRTVNTGGGDYAEGNIDKREGAFVSGGTVYGPVVGRNDGEITASYGSLPHPQVDVPTLQGLRKQLRAAVDGAVARGDSALAAELDEIEALLSDALAAERAGNAAQRARKLGQAKRDLADLAARRPELGELAGGLQGLE